MSGTSIQCCICTVITLTLIVKSLNVLQTCVLCYFSSHSSFTQGLYVEVSFRIVKFIQGEDASILGQYVYCLLKMIIALKM